MVQFFRLLFTGAILFILLALVHHQNGDSVAQERESEKIEFTEYGAGLLPSGGRIYSLNATSNTLSKFRVSSQKNELKENYNLKISENRLARISADFSEYKPAILLMSGHKMHRVPDKDIPPIS